MLIEDSSKPVPRYVIARDAQHWRAYDTRLGVFVASAQYRKRKADARADARELNTAEGLPSYPS